MVNFVTLATTAKSQSDQRPCVICTQDISLNSRHQLDHQRRVCCNNIPVYENRAFMY